MKSEVPAMPCVPTIKKHRPKNLLPLYPACVAEPVKRKDIEKFPAAIEARAKESNNLREKGVWLLDTVEGWSSVAARAREKGDADGGVGRDERERDGGDRKGDAAARVFE